MITVDRGRCCLQWAVFLNKIFIYLQWLLFLSTWKAKGMRKGQSIYSRHKKQWYLAEMETIQSESVLWHLRGAEGDRLREQSEGRKLPQRKPRALAT